MGGEELIGKGAYNKLTVEEAKVTYNGGCFNVTIKIKTPDDGERSANIDFKVRPLNGVRTSVTTV